MAVGSSKKQATPISEDQEELLRSRGLIGGRSPRSLLNTMVYNNGLYIALRSGKEHRNLRGDPCQITVVEPPDTSVYLKYVEDCSKNKPAGLKGRSRKRKEVIQHANLNNSERCPVSLFKYQSLYPKERPANAFYRKPLSRPSSTCWYAKSAVGYLELQKTVVKVCIEAGFEGFYTSHSLRDVEARTQTKSMRTST